MPCRPGRAVLGPWLLVALTATARAQRDDETFQVAVGLLQRGLHEDAATQLRAFLAAQPKHALAREAWYRLGTCCEEQKQLEAAAEAYRKALAGRGDFALLPECRYRQGLVLRALGKHEEGWRVLRELLEGVPRDHYLRVPARYAEGECLRALGQTEAALAAFADAAESDRDGKAGFGMPALYQAGFALLALERFGDAAGTFATAAERFPQHEAANECRWLEGDAASRAKDWGRAERAFEQALAAGGAFADDAAMGLAWCRLEAGDERSALARFREVLEQHQSSPHAPRAGLEAGRCLHRQGQHEAALALLAPLLAEGVDAGLRAPALELTGLCLLDTGKEAAAVEHLTQALALGEAASKPRLEYELGEAQAALEQWEPALGAYGRAVEGAADEALRGDARYGKALALHKLGRAEEALAEARALLQAAPAHRLAAYARFAIAESLFALQRWADAAAAYADVPRDHELAVKAAFKRAWCAFLAGEHGMAASRFAALAKDPGAPFAEEALSMQALAHLQAGELDQALTAADQYRARHAEGAFLARTERVASRVLRERGDLRAAAQRMAVAAKAERSGEQSVLDRLEQAELAFQQGDFAAASELYGPLAARDDRPGGQARLGLAWCAFELRDDAECLQRLDAVQPLEAMRDRLPEVLELRLSVLHRLERWVDATAVARAFLAAHGEHPRAPEVRLSLGIALARGEQAAEACQVFAALAAEQRLERPERLYYEWAWACRAAGDEPGALAAFAKVTEIGQEQDRVGEAHLHLGLAELGRKEAAAARRRLLAVQGKHRPQALYRAGFSWLEDNEPGLALPCFDEVIALGESEALYVEALFFAGEALARLERHDEAVQRFRTLLAQAPDHARGQMSRLRAGQSLLLLGQADRAVPLLEECLARGGIAQVEQAQAHLTLGKARAARGEHERAEQSFQQVTVLSEGELGAEAQLRIGEVRQARGDWAGAADAYVKLSILYEHAPWVQKGLLAAGLAFAASSQPAKAQKFWKELVLRYPEAPESEQARQLLSKPGGP